MSVARFFRAALVNGGIAIGGLVAGYLVLAVVTLALVSSIDVYFSVIVPLLVALAIVLSSVGYGVVRRQEIRSDTRVATFVAACAVPSIATVAIYISLFIERSQL